jgi:hypothetical protein
MSCGETGQTLSADMEMRALTIGTIVILGLVTVRTRLWDTPLPRRAATRARASMGPAAAPAAVDLDAIRRAGL